MTKQNRFKHLGLFIRHNKGNVLVVSEKYKNDINFQNKINK